MLRDDPSAHATALAETLAAFRRAGGERDDPAAPFAVGMRAACRGYETGTLAPADRALLSALLQCAEQALHRAAVPVLLTPEHFGNVRARMAEFLGVWSIPFEHRAEWSPDYAAGFAAMLRLLANDVEAASLIPIAIRGRTSDGRSAPAPAGPTHDHNEGSHAGLSLTRH